MKVSDYIAQWLKMKKIEVVFGYQGSSITHLIDSTVRSGIQYVQNYHEQAAAFSANAVAHVSGNFGVAMVCSGPGATNLVTGIANAYYDSLPCLFFTGQVSIGDMKDNELRRQKGFQETDIVSIVHSITKYAVTVHDPKDIKFHLEKAFYLMKSGRPGPVLIDLPHNVQKADFNTEFMLNFLPSKTLLDNSEEQEICVGEFEKIVEVLEGARRPLLLLGGGMRKLKDTQIWGDFLEIMKIPIVVSLRGLDIVNHEYRNYCGFIGSYGNRYANLAVACADVILVLGSRLDDRQTGGLDNFASEAKIVQIEIDEAELIRKIPRVIGIRGSCENFIQWALAYGEKLFYERISWNDKIAKMKHEYPAIKELANGKGINPNKFIAELFMKMAGNCTIAVDVGQHQMWAAQSISLKKGSFLLASCGHGAMGYALPAIIGSAYTGKTDFYMCIVGDGGFQMNIQELQRIAHDNLDIKIFIFNNHSLGLIRDYQEKVLDGRNYGSVLGYSTPDFSKIASAYGLQYIKITNEDQHIEWDELFEKRAVIVEVILAEDSVVYPEPSYGRPVFDQYPLIDRDELDRILSEGK